jgi:hypothetical protein
MLYDTAIGIMTYDELMQIVDYLKEKR